MTTSITDLAPEIPAIIRKQRYHTFWRFIWRDLLLRPLGFPIIARPVVEGRHHIPKTGPTIVIYNHINFFDPVILLGTIYNRATVPISKMENLHLPLFGLMVRTWGVIPVQRRNLDRKALDDTQALLNHGYCMLIAPEGTRRPALSEPKEGFTYAALKTGATIVPAAIEGTTEISSNLKKLRRTRVTVRFGQPFRYKINEIPPRETLRHMTLEAMYQLAQLLSAERRGIFSDLSQMTTDTLDFLP